MSNIWLVAEREFLINVRKKSFLFAMFGTPILMGVLFAIIMVATYFAETQGVSSLDSKIGYVDANNIVIEESVPPPENFIRYSDVESARTALESGEVGAYFVIPPLYLSTGAVSLYAVKSTSAELQSAVEDFLVANLTAKINTDIPVERLREPVDYSIFLENQGREVEEAGIIGMLLVPLLFVVVMMMGLQLSSVFLMSGLVEEKTNRIMEVLITTISPYQLMTGKILGLSGLGLLQITVWLVLGGVMLFFTQSNPFLATVSFPLDFVALALVYFLLTYFLFASILSGIGVIANGEEQARQYAGGISLFLAVPLIFVSLYILDPNSPIITVLNLIPFTAGMSVILQMTFTPVPAWEIALSLGILVVTTLFCLWASAKIFRWGLLMYGQKVTALTLWRVITEKTEMGALPSATKGAK